MNNKRRYLLSIIFCLIGIDSYSQQNKSASVAAAHPVADSCKVDSINIICWHLTQKGFYDSAILYANRTMQISTNINYTGGLIGAFINFGNIYSSKGDYSPALSDYFKALEIAKRVGNKRIISHVSNNIGIIYSNRGNYAEALKEYLVALRINEELDKKIEISRDYNNIGVLYSDLGNYDEALKNFVSSLQYADKINDSIMLSHAYYGIGNCYMYKKDFDSAMANENKALKLSMKTGEKTLESSVYKDFGTIYFKEGLFDAAFKNYTISLNINRMLGDKPEVGVMDYYLGQLYMEKKETKIASQYLDSALTVSRSVGDKKNMESVYRIITHLDSMEGNYPAVLGDYELYNKYHDSIINEETARKMEGEKLSYDFEQQTASDKAEEDKKIARQRLVRNLCIGGFGFAFLFAGIFFLQRRRITKERDKSDKLLLNILPAETAKELKATGESKARNYSLVTVMFTDFKDFTRQAETMTADELVNEINYCFKEFDKINARHNVEKIKTMGDGYMAAGGVPHENTTNPVETVAAALEIQQFMQKMQEERRKENRFCFEVRIGIHSGPVIAGIVGLNKFAYDIWGDTVNIAARMEAGGEVGKVNISGSTYELVKDTFTCTYRGKIQAKNKGEVDMYFVSSKE